MSNLHQWIIVIQIVLNSSGGGLGAGDDREHVHIKVHIPELNRKHTHFRKIQKHYFHPKKVVKAPEFLDAELDTTPFSMLSYGIADHAQAMQFPSYSMNLPAFPDMPYGVDNTLEATVMKKPKITSMPQFMSESMVSKFHGMKKPSEFMGARPAEEMHKFAAQSDESEDSDYDARSTEAMVLDQRVAGSSYPYSMSLGGSYKSKWPPYSNLFENSMKPFSSSMKWSAGLPADWFSGTTEGDYSGLERFPSPTTMHIAKAKPLSRSRLKFEQHSFDSEPSYTETMIAPKKKKSKHEKRSRTPSPAFRINY